MGKVLAYNNGDTKIGAYRFPDRKKPCLCIIKGNEATVYGTFLSESAADEFMNELGSFVGAVKED